MISSTYVLVFWCGLVLLPLFATASLVAQSEIQVLHGFHSSTDGDSWAWRDEISSGVRWNFSTGVDAGGAVVYLDNPCSSGGRAWQGLACSSTPAQCVSQSCSVVQISLQAYNIQGKIPDEWGALSRLQELTLWQNRLSGTVPKSLSQVTSLTIVNLEENMLADSFPSALCSLPLLSVLRIGRNLLTGPVSAEVSRLMRLTWLSVFENMFTGPLPPELAQLPFLQRIYLFDNLFTGPLQPSYARLQYLGIYAVHKNLLTGTVIPELAAHSFLLVLSLQECLFTGSVPAELGNLRNLNFLYMFMNSFSGSLPPSLSQLTRLQRFSISQNHLTGPLPPEYGALVSISYLYIYENQMTGSLPDNLGNLRKMEVFTAHSNHLTGPLPLGLANLTRLQRLTLQNNRLTGSLHNEALFSSRHASLELLDLSNNILSGSVPRSFFLLPRITTLALSKNCFQGDLPRDMCFARELQVLALDGLGAAQGCRHEYVLPVTGVSLFNTLDGSVPQCLWNLRNLSVLHLASNGLQGSIMDRGLVVHDSPIVDLSLAHNHITGTIPRHIRSVNFTFLDLSFNKLTGKQQDNDGHHGHSTYTNPRGSVVILEVNRLSGPLPASEAFSQVGELRVLRDNLFSCDYIPSADEYSNKYSCGSQNLNVSIYLFLAFSAGLVLALAAGRWLVSREEAGAPWLLRLQGLISRHAGFYSLFGAENLQGVRCEVLGRICNTQLSLRFTVVLLVLLLLVLLLAGAPLFSLKLAEYGHVGDTFSTHSFQYLWVASMAFISGELPALLIMAAWLVSMASCTALFIEWERVAVLLARIFPSSPLFAVLSSSASSSSASSSASLAAGPGSSASSSSASKGGGELITRERKLSIAQSKTRESSFKREFWGLAGVFLLNLLVEGVLNISFVYSSYKPLSSTQHTLCQVALAVTKSLHNNVLLPMLAAKLVKSTRQKMHLRLILSIVNCVFIPGVATAFTSPACFKNLIVPADEISSSYQYRYCSLFEPQPDGSVGECMEMTTETADVIPIVPPFSYNNQCFSVLLITYIPVYVFVYSFQAISPFLLLLLFTNVDFLSLPAGLRQPGVAIGMCWPSFWRKEHADPQPRSSLSARHGPPEDEDLASARVLFDHKKFYLKIAYHLTILLTFGVCSPVLATIVVTSLALQVLAVVYLVGRFVEQRLGTHDLGAVLQTDDHALRALSTISIDICMFEHLVWPLFWGSSFFFACMTWDLVVDRTDDWLGALWAPLACLAAPLVVRTSLRVREWWTARALAGEGVGLLQRGAPAASGGVEEAHDEL